MVAALEAQSQGWERTLPAHFIAAYRDGYRAGQEAMRELVERVAQPLLGVATPAFARQLAQDQLEIVVAALREMPDHAFRAAADWIDREWRGEG